MSWQAVQAVRDYSKVSDTVGYAVFVSIASYCDADGTMDKTHTPPSIGRLANDARCSKPTVISWIKKLEKGGELLVRREGTGKGKKNFYTVVLDMADSDNSQNTFKANPMEKNHITNQIDYLVSMVESLVDPTGKEHFNGKEMVKDTPLNGKAMVKDTPLNGKAMVKQLLTHNSNSNNKSKSKEKYPLPSGFEFPIELKQSQAFMTVWDDWEKHRKELKKGLKPMTRKSQLKKAASHSAPDAIWVIEQSIENGWQGLFWDKLDNRAKGKEAESQW